MFKVLILSIFISTSVFAGVIPEWQSLPNKINPNSLDQFIAVYPQSEAVPIAFTLRYQIVQGVGKAQGVAAIPYYHDFIVKYRDTTAAYQSMYELFELYKKRATGQQNIDAKLATYLEFMFLYPNTEIALVAKRMAEQTAFEKVAKIDTSAAYEDFIQLFPNAPQVLVAEELATDRAIKYEESSKSKARVNKLCTYLGELGNKLLSAKDTDSSLHRHFNRLKKVILTNYATYNNASCVRKEEHHQEKMAALNRIEKTIKTGNAKLIKVFKEESEKTRQVLRAGFKQLHLDNVNAQQSLDTIINGVKILHEHLVEVNTNLRGIRVDVQKVGEYIKESNKKLDVLHRDLQQVHKSIVKFNQDFNQGMLFKFGY